MKEKYDVVIVGAGPAGLAAAKYLAENDKSVLVLEKNRVVGDKLCAGGLTKKDFEAINPPSYLIERKFNLVDFYIDKRLLKIEMDDCFAWTVNRKKLGEWQLQETEKAGAEVLLNTKVSKIEKDFILTDENKRIFYDYLIGADGSNSLVRKYLDLKTEKVGVAIEYCIPIKDIRNRNAVIYTDLNVNFWYFWVFPHQEFVWVGTGADSKRVNGKELKEKLDSWCQKMEIKTDGYEIKAASLNYDYKGVKFGNIFLAGDAAGLISSLTGEGIHPAIISGVEVGRKIINPKHSFKELKEVLKWKRFEERIVAIYSINKTFAKILFWLAFILLKNDKIKKRAVNFFTLK